MLRVSVRGVSSPQRFQQLREVVPGRSPYRQGTDPTLLLDFQRREEADLAVVNLNLLPGIQARILGDWSAE
jgi:hypothetical protein